jgi:cytochrome c-type biogenesis protein CcmH
MKILIGFFLLVLSITPGLAVEPSEVLDDPVLEQRAREVSKGLRCVVCQNQSIDDSNAELARDMRVLVRERIVAGDTNQQVSDYMVSRYGDFVLLKPPLNTATYVLWFGPVLIVGIGILALFFFYRRRRDDGVTASEAPPVALSDEERLRLDALMKDET